MLRHSVLSYINKCARWKSAACGSVGLWDCPIFERSGWGKRWYLARVRRPVVARVSKVARIRRPVVIVCVDFIISKELIVRRLVVSSGDRDYQMGPFLMEPWP